MTALRFRRLVRECLSTRPGAIPLGLAFPEQYVVGVDVVTPGLCHPIVPSAVLNPSLSLPPSPLLTSRFRARERRWLAVEVQGERGRWAGGEGFSTCPFARLWRDPPSTTRPVSVVPSRSRYRSSALPLAPPLISTTRPCSVGQAFVASTPRASIRRCEPDRAVWGRRSSPRSG